MSEATTETTSLEKKAVRTSPVLWLLGAALAVLLGALGTRALFDLGELFPEPRLETFRDPRVAPLAGDRAQLDELERERSLVVQRAERDLETLEHTLATAEQSWRSWLETRATLGGNSAEDREVRARRDRLDKLRAERDQAAAQVRALRREPDPQAEARATFDAHLREAEDAASTEYAAAVRAYEARTLGARLGLLVPMMALAAWLWRQRKKSKYLTLLWGYWAFAVWMLGLGIYPYLPHYGGYAPLAGGVGLTLWLSVALVRYFNRRAAARRRRIVDLAIARHRCPGCDRDYLVGREIGLSLALARKATTRQFDAAALRPQACPGCGLSLFGPCPSCHAVQVVHLDHCASCGAAWATRLPTSPGSSLEPLQRTSTATGDEAARTEGP